MSQHVLTIEARELDKVGFRCEKCATEVVFDANTDPSIGTPYHCPTCKEQYVELAQCLAKYREFYRAASSALKARGIHFRVSLRVPPNA